VPQHVGIDQNCAQLVENNERQQKKYSVNRPTRSFKIGVLRKVKQLACAVFEFVFHPVSFFIIYALLFAIPDFLCRSRFPLSFLLSFVIPAKAGIHLFAFFLFIFFLCGCFFFVPLCFGGYFLIFAEFNSNKPKLQ